MFALLDCKLQVHLDKALTEYVKKGRNLVEMPTQNDVFMVLVVGLHNFVLTFFEDN